MVPCSWPCVGEPEVEVQEVWEIAQALASSWVRTPKRNALAHNRIGWGRASCGGTGASGSLQERHPTVARILLIDDDESLRRPLKMLLERAGHEVLPAANGPDGLRLWRERGGDLVITDIHMPGKNGLETILEVRHHAPQARILAMSGGDRNARVDVLGAATLLGAVRTILKPFTLTEMLQAVEEALRLDCHLAEGQSQP